MSAAKHTPGPWELEITTSDSGWRPSEQSVQVWHGEQLIASYVTGYVEYPDSATNEANARLIAAAPELLDALQSLLHAWDVVCDLKGWDRDHLVAVDVARAAISKATRSTE